MWWKGRWSREQAGELVSSELPPIHSLDETRAHGRSSRGTGHGIDLATWAMVSAVETGIVLNK